MKMIILNEIDSTNEYIKRKYLDLPTCTCVLARKQTAGKGRRNHVWHSQDNQNLTVSFLYKDINSIEDGWKYTMIAAKSVIDLLAKYHINSTIKWPNDIYVENQKICGILVETIIETSLKGIVIGIGLNVNEASPYISMKDITKKQYDIAELLLQLILCFNDNLNLFYNQQFLQILRNVNNLSYLKDKWVDYENYGKVQFKKLNERGMLEFTDQNGNDYQKMINEISLEIKTK